MEQVQKAGGVKTDILKLTAMLQDFPIPDCPAKEKGMGVYELALLPAKFAASNNPF